MITEATPQTPQVLSEHTVTLLRKVAAHILAEPRRIEMFHFGQQIHGGDISPSLKEQYPPCGTHACIAGWAQLLSDPNVTFNNEGMLLTRLPFGYFDGNDEEGDFDAIAAKTLGITRSQANRLFYFHHWIGESRGSVAADGGAVGWPPDYASLYLSYAQFGDSTDPGAVKMRAQITAERIEHFIKTNGWE